MSGEPLQRRAEPRAQSASGLTLIVRRGAVRRFERLQRGLEGLPAVVRWDRRQHERRVAANLVDQDRRKNDRRGTPPYTWDTADFVVVTSGIAIDDEPGR